MLNVLCRWLGPPCTELALVSSSQALLAPLPDLCSERNALCLLYSVLCDEPAGDQVGGIPLPTSTIADEYPQSYVQTRRTYLWVHNYTYIYIIIILIIGIFVPLCTNLGDGHAKEDRPDRVIKKLCLL